MRDIPKKDYNHIVGLAKKYAAKSYSFIDADDLIQEGCMAYIKGYDKYDSSKNNYYMGFIYRRVVGAMLDYIASMSYNGKSTVRNTNKDSDIKVTSLEVIGDINSVDVEDELVSQADSEILYNRFYEYLQELTVFEKSVLIDYFVYGNSMVKIGEKYGISRLRIKRILLSCLSYLKRNFYKDFTIAKISEISRV